MMRLAALPLLLLLGAGPAAPQEAAPAADPEGLAFFESKIRPVLIDKCYSCHSAEAGKSKGQLLVDSRAALLKGGETGPAVVPGDLDKSLLIQAVRWAQEELRMPPKTRLPKTVVADFEAWVKRGAPDPRTGSGPAAKKGIDVDQARQTWAYRRLQQVPVPAGAAHPVDAFLRERQKAAGVAPNAPADARRLARRAAFGLTGLPPAAGDIEKLAADPASWPAYVDRLLADPAFGERQARHWLDVARFAESHGFEQDYDRENAWHYRDFVIQAFNADLPYDRFVQWQVAGDELAPSDPLAWMATGFLGAGVFPTQLTEVEFEPARYEELDSMASTTASAFLATTLGCARCHDHKFDPIATRDYYRLTSAFTTTIRSMAEFPLDPEADRAALATWEAARPRLAEALAAYEREMPAKFKDWTASRGWEQLPASPWILLDPVEWTSQGGATITAQPDGSRLLGGKNPAQDLWKIRVSVPIPGLRALRIEALADASLPKQGPGRAPNGNFALGDLRVTHRPAGGGDPVRLKLSAARWTFQQNEASLSAASSVDGDAKASGWAVDPQVGKGHAAVFIFAEPVGAGELLLELEFAVNGQHVMGRPRLSASTEAGAPLEGAAGEARIARLKAGASPTIEDFRALDPGYRMLAEALRAHDAAKPAPKLTKVLVTTEGMKPLKHHADDRGFPHFYKETHILARGDVNKKQGVATIGFLPVLTRPGTDESRWISAPPEGARSPHRRAALARWLTDVDAGAGALAARVMANRVWAQHFGRGIVSSTNDFGAQGDKPTHPELLEWLAGELVRNGWSLKKLYRLLLTSEAYRASTAVSPEAAAKDPDNRLFWRQEPRRLEAEPIRDTLLHVAGLLDRRMYGAGTLDEGMTRRAVYFFQKRSKLIPMMTVFDAPEPLVSQGSRPTTTIAPQALLFMNSPLVRKSAAALAKASATPAEAYQRALGRAPSGAESAKAAAFLEAQSASYRAAGRADAELAARTDLCHALLCLNEFVYVD